MKKLLTLLGSAIITTSSFLPVVACGGTKTGQKDTDNDTSDDGTLTSKLNATSQLTKMLLLGKHENLNFQPSQVITSLYASNYTQFGLPTKYFNNDNAYDYSANIINFETGMNPIQNLIKTAAANSSIMSGERRDTRIIMPQTFVGMYNDDFYNDYLIDGNYNPSNTVFNDERKELIGYNADLGTASPYFTARGFVYNGNEDNPVDGITADDDVNAFGSAGIPSYEIERRKQSNFLFDNDKTFFHSTENDAYSVRSLGEADVYDSMGLGVKSTNEAIESIGVGGRFITSLASLSLIDNSAQGQEFSYQALDNLLGLAWGSDENSGANDNTAVSKPLALIEREIVSTMLKYISSEGNLIYSSLETIASPVDGLNYAEYLQKLVNTSDSFYKLPSSFDLALQNVSYINFMDSNEAQYYGYSDGKISDANYGIEALPGIFETIDGVLQTLSTEDQVQFIADSSKNAMASIIASIKLFVVLSKPLLPLQNILEYVSDYWNDNPDTATFDIYNIFGAYSELIGSLFNSTNFGDIASIGQSASNVNDLNISDSQKMRKYLGSVNGSITEDSVMDVIIKAFTDSTATGYRDLTFLLTNTDESPFYSANSEEVNVVHENFLQYVDDKYWNLSDYKYEVSDDNHETLSYTLGYSGPGDISVEKYVTESQTDAIDYSQGGVGGLTDDYNYVAIADNSEDNYFNGHYSVRDIYMRATNNMTNTSETAYSLTALDNLLKYSGTGMEYAPVDHKYDVTWTNVGDKQNPMWVITNLDSFVNKDEVPEDLVTTNQNYQQIYFLYDYDPTNVENWSF